MSDSILTERNSLIATTVKHGAKNNTAAATGPYGRCTTNATITRNVIVFLESIGRFPRFGYHAFIIPWPHMNGNGGAGAVRVVGATVLNKLRELGAL